MTTKDVAYTVFWSEEDECWMGVNSEFAGIKCHGGTPTSALLEVMMAVELGIEVLAEGAEDEGVRRG